MNYAVSDTQLGAIADAIRLKLDSAAEMTVDDMPMQIGLIDGGGGDTYPHHLHAETMAASRGDRIAFNVPGFSDIIKNGNNYVAMALRTDELVYGVQPADSRNNIFLSGAILYDDYRSCLYCHVIRTNGVRDFYTYVNVVTIDGDNIDIKTTSAVLAGINYKLDIIW